VEPKDSRELFALLSAKVQRFHLAPGGIPALTAEDVAHALGMIQHDDARAFARMKYCAQWHFTEGLARAIRMHMMTRKLDDSWRIPRVGFLLDLAYLMLTEAIDPFTCTWCCGRAAIRDDKGLVIECQACDGSGKRPMRDMDRARMMNIPKSSWSDTWGARYRATQIDTVDVWEDVIGGALRRRIA
jgi:hypothetical protein